MLCTSHLSSVGDFAIVGFVKRTRFPAQSLRMNAYRTNDITG